MCELGNVTTKCFSCLKIGMIHKFSCFLCFEEHFKRNFIQPLLHFIYIVHIDQIYKLLLMFISKDIYIYLCIYRHFSTSNVLFSYSLSILQKFKQLKKSFLEVSFYPVLWDKWDSVPCLILNIFTIWTKWVTTPSVCFIYSNNMIYHPVQFYALCPVLSGVTLSFNTKCLIMPRTTLCVM